MFYQSPILKTLIAAAGREPQQKVLYTGKASYTAAEILSASKHLAYRLSAIGMQKDDRIVIAIAPGIEFITIMYATIMLRAKVAIIDPEMGPELYRTKFNQLQPKWAFVDTRLLLLQEHPLLRYAYFKLAAKPVYFPKYPGLKIIGCGPRLPLLQRYTHYSKLLKAPSGPVELMEDTSDHDYLITYTSGTVSEPKGVLHGFKALSTSIQLLSKVVKNQPGDIMATYLPHFALIGIAAQLPIFLYDAKLGVNKKLKFLEEKKITILFGPPSDFLPMIKHCENEHCKLPSTLKHLMLGSAPVHQSFLKRLAAVAPAGIRLTITYGMTEHLLISTVDGMEKLNYTGTGDLVGKPVEGVNVKIADDGELLVKSDQLYSRYFHLESRDEYHASGDLARVDVQGNILLMGRKKEMIIRSNTNIYPALYEGTIKKIPGIEEAVLVGIYNTDKEDEDVYLAIETSREMTAKQVMDKIAYGEFQIEKNALPDHIIFMTIPRRGRQNKIDRNKIAELIKAANA
ncbi:class I adenylate-forming enzyme family protein [soil metagenome]|jgi:acyl-CoA synthetase (AMP-forming)/AMP-acid ligase II